LPAAGHIAAYKIHPIGGIASSLVSPRCRRHLMLYYPSKPPQMRTPQWRSDLDLPSQLMQLSSRLDRYMWTI
jgi:hypothetical protein